MTSSRAGDIGQRMYALIEELYPICRSITGNGFRETMRRIGTRIPLEIHEVPTGTTVYDWTVPNEWNIRDAYVARMDGTRVIDFQRSNLHVVNYSTPVDRTMSLDELRPHLHTLPDHPDWIPYRTTYYHESWGFCLARRVLDAMEEGTYRVRIDATLAPGFLTYGEFFLAGETDEEVLISCHSCHPSLCNDNLSGISLAVGLAEHLGSLPVPRYSYRFLFIPGTIGSITWLARNAARVGRVRHGLVLSCVGDAGTCTYKRSRRGSAVIDRAVEHVLGTSGESFEVLDFVPYGYDERQYCSPGFDLPVGCFMRTPNGRYPEYHTSADDLSFVHADRLADSFAKVSAVLDILEHDRVLLTTNPRCEPQLGRRGLYSGVAGGGHELPGYELALLWVLNQCDGMHTLLDIAARASLPFGSIRQAANDLERHGLLRPVEAETSVADQDRAHSPGA